MRGPTGRCSYEIRQKLAVLELSRPMCADGQPVGKRCTATGFDLDKKLLRDWEHQEEEEKEYGSIYSSGMTTLAPADIATSRAAPLSYVRPCGGAFPPALGNPMTDNNPSEGRGGSCGKHGVDGCGSTTMAVDNGRCKRELEPGRAEEAPRAKRISPLPFMRHDRARKNAEAEVWRADASPSTANESGSSESEDLTRDAVAEARTTDGSSESGLLGQACPSPLSFSMESDGVVDFESSNASSGGGGDGGLSSALGNPMTDNNPVMDGGGRTGSRQSSSTDGCGPNTSSRRRGRAREPGKEEKPAPAKRMSPISLRRRDGGSGGPDSEIWRVDPSPPRDSSESDSPHLKSSKNEDSSEAIVSENRPEPAPRVRSCRSSSFKRESSQSEDYGKLEPGGEEERPPPPTAISQIPFRRHDRARRSPDATAFLNLDAFITNDTSDSGLLELENLVGEAVSKADATGSLPELELLDYSCLSSLQLESDGNFGEDNENGGGGDSVLPLPQALDPSLAVATCFSSSLLDTATTRTLGPSPIQTNTMSTDRFLRPLLGRAASDGELSRRSRGSVQGLGGLGPKLSSPSPLRVDNCRWDILKPSQAQEGSVENVSKGGRGCPEISCQSVECPLGAGLKASSSWDPSCASRAPPRCRVDFSTLPALCDSGGNSGCGSGSIGTEDRLGNVDDGSKRCSCSGVLTPSITCLSPPFIARGTGTESTGGGTDQCLSADFDVLGDNMLSHALRLSPPPEVVEGSSRKDDRGGVRAAGEVEGLGFVIPDMNIEKCMATLQATPTDAGVYEESSVQLSSPLSVDPCDDGGSCGTDHSDADGAQEAGLVVDTQPQSSGDGLEAEGDDDGEIEQEEEQEGGCNRGEPEIRIGDAHQAVIPDITYRSGNRVVDSSLARAPPLQLWSPGIAPERALDLALPRPRRGDAGSSDLEQKMLSAYLIARASGRELKRCDGRAAATNDGGRLVCRFGGADDDAAASVSSNRGSHGESTESLETLAEVVAEGVGCVWKSDWPEKDKKAFRKGIYVFRRNFSRIRAAFLPHREHGELVDFYYRRWKRNPGYFAWKNTDQLIGRRVAQRVETNETRPQGAGLGKCLDALGMQRGCVVRKKLRGWKEMFVVRFPPNGSFQATFETVPLGVLETMLVEDSTTDKERTSEAHDGARAAQNLGEIAALNAGAWFSPGRSASSSATGSRCGHLDPRPPLGASTHMRGRYLGWQTGGSNTGDIDEEKEFEQNCDSSAVVSEVGESRKTGDRDDADWMRMPRNMQAEDSGNADEKVNKDEDEGVYEDYVTEKEGSIDMAERERETEEAHASGRGVSDSDSGPETDDNTENECAMVSSPGDRESRSVVYGARDEVAHGARNTSVGESGICNENCPSPSIYEGKRTDFFASAKDMSKIHSGVLKYLTHT